MQRLVLPSCLVLGLALGFSAACGAPGPLSEEERNFTSDVATLLVMDFDAQLVSSTAQNPQGQIRAQLLYTVGHLNAEPGVSRLDKLNLSNVTVTPAGGGLWRIRYHVKLPVAWGHQDQLPTQYTFTLPLRLDLAGQQAFLAKYSPACTEHEGAQVSVDNLWYHYRPHDPACTLQAADVMVARATAQVSTLNTMGKFPEFHKVWEDGQLNVVAVFGKYASGATGADDAGIAAYNAFAAAIHAELNAWPAGIPDVPGAAHPEVTVRAGNVNVTMLLVDGMRETSPAWDKRFAELTPGADLILYNGHAGLGANVAALVQKGSFFPGKYQILFLDGCDTFAYADDTMARRRASLNPDDGAGTKYLDVIANAMPAYFSSMPDASMALLRALRHPETPLTYPQIFKGVNPAHVVVVTGEEDNVFTRATAILPRWHAVNEEAFVGKGESVLYTADLAAGTYVFATTPDPSIAGGDADLRVRAGAMPTQDQTYKCQSYVGNSNERCKLTLAAPARVHVTVTGDAAGTQSHFILKGWSL